jgi:hypothetical protein
MGGNFRVQKIDPWHGIVMKWHMSKKDAIEIQRELALVKFTLLSFFGGRFLSKTSA